MPITLIKRLVRSMRRPSEADSSTTASSPSPRPSGSRRRAAANVPAPAAESRDGTPRRRRRRGGKRSGQGAGAPARAPEARGSRPPRSAEPWDPSQVQVEPCEGKTRFQDVDLPVELLHAVHDLGFEYCTPIQAGVLAHLADRRHVTGRAQTGTGKTAAFLLTCFADFLRNPPEAEREPGCPRALVLAPTRELAVQIVKDAKALGAYTSFRCEAVYGGMDYRKQQEARASAPVDLVAATPGRLLDFASKRVLNLSRVEILVIDEADRMLDMGFIPDVRRIVRQTPPREKRRTLFFSATLTDDVKRLADQWTINPLAVDIEPEQVAVETVDQVVYAVATREKFTVLVNMLRDPAMQRVLVFANRRDRTAKLKDRLQRRGIACELLSGDVEQKKRLRILDDFRSGKLRVVVATDVAGRGIHVDDVTHVVNFDFPYEPEDYVHRIGRTGRVGTSGTAISFACEDESFIIPDIEAYIGRPLPCRVPDEALLKPVR